jgi:multidrug efflux system outer membrane protein
MTPLRILLVAGASMLAVACAVGPRYEAPNTPPVAVINAAPETASAAEPEAAWWRAFEDPVLDDLVGKALAGNLDIRIALDRVREARALFSDAERDRLPRVTVGADYSRGRQQVPQLGGGRADLESADLGFDAGWELDLFGRVRHGIEAAGAEAGAADADANFARVTVAAEVARNYFELRGAQARRAVAEANAGTQRETLRLTQARFEVGAGDRVDVESATARLRATEAAIPDMVTAEAHAKYRLAVLLGQRPGAVDAQLGPRPTPLPPMVKPLPIGDASQFLRRRPDVAAAERRLAAETARTGVATADLFPRVSVTGFVGLLSGDVAGLFKANPSAWSVAPSVSWPGLDFGGARARLRAQEARGDAALAAYDQTVLRAIEDLETALVAYRQQQLQIAALAQQVAASRNAADLARIRYREGSIDFLVLLDAERTRLAAEDALSVAETGANTDIVAIYKALGGGWTAAEAQPPSPTSTNGAQAPG